MTRELDRAVSEKLGYRARRLDTSAYSDQEMWCLLSPDGHVYRDGAPFPQGEEATWGEFAPCFSTDLEMAMALVPEQTSQRSFALRQLERGWVACISDLNHTSGETTFEAVADTPAEAICRAWLKWQTG